MMVYIVAFKEKNNDILRELKWPDNTANIKQKMKRH